MKRGSLFFIGLISAIATFAGLSYALGRPAYYERYHYYNHHHCYNEQHDNRYDERYNHDYRQRNDSATNNY